MLFSFFLFLVFSYVITKTNYVKELDKSVSNFVFKNQDRNLVWLSNEVGKIFDFENTFLIIIFGTLFLWFKFSKKEASFFLSSMVFTIVLSFIIKDFFGRNRPLSGLGYPFGFSFPSGHAVLAIVFFGLIFFFSIKKIKTRKNRYILAIIFSITAFLIGLSRVYLNVHWFSDVIGGFLLGLFLISSFVILKEFYERKKLLK